MYLGMVIVANATRALVHDNNHTKSPIQLELQHHFLPGTGRARNRDVQMTQKHAETNDTNGCLSR